MMPIKPTFFMRMGGNRPKPTKYNPIIYTRHSSVYRFALHKVERDWVVSEPVSGFRVLRVSAYFKGCPIVSDCLNLKQAREAALIDLDLLVDRIGFYKFEAVVNDAIKNKEIKTMAST